MATKPDYGEFITEQLGGATHGVTCRKMFGEYGLHAYGKFFALICNDTLYFKPTQAGKALLEANGALELAPPYEGAKDYFQINCPDDRELLASLRDATVNELPEPKPKKVPRSKARPKD